MSFWGQIKLEQRPDWYSLAVSLGVFLGVLFGVTVISLLTFACSLSRDQLPVRLGINHVSGSNENLSISVNISCVLGEFNVYQEPSLLNVYINTAFSPS